MGREIRKVIPNFEHPKRSYPNHRLGRMEEGYQPLYDKDFETAMKSWLDSLATWMAGGFENARLKNPELNYDPEEPYRAFVGWESSAPEKEFYRPRWKEEDATWLQMYETVSEGTPVTPPFATPEELVEYLVTNGDFWDQKRRAEGNCSMDCGPWKREHAESFVRRGWSPSMMVERSASGTTIKKPRDGI